MGDTIDMRVARQAEDDQKFTHIGNRVKLAGEKQELIERITPELGRLSLPDLRTLAAKIETPVEDGEIDG